MMRRTVCPLGWALAAGLVLASGCKPEEPAPARDVPVERAKKLIPDVSKAANGVARPKKEVRGGAKPTLPKGDDAPEMTEAEKVMLDDLTRILKEEDGEAAIRVMADVKKQNNASLREEYLKVAGWLGPQMLPEITEFIGDKDENVALEARTQWIDCLYRTEDPAEKAELVRYALTELNQQELAGFAAEELNDLPRESALDVVLDGLINGTVAGQAAARTAYEIIVGDKYTTAAAARQKIGELLKEE